MTADQNQAKKQTKDLLKAAILMKATSVSEDSFSFPQQDTMTIDIKEEADPMDESNEQFDERSSEEEERYRKKKELNRLAAQRSRERRRLLIQTLEQQVSELEKCNDSLTTEITSMRSEIEQLDYILQNHNCKMVQ